MGKAGEVPDSIRKGVEAAKKNMITVPLDGTTIPHEVEEKFGASIVLIKPAAPGTGVIAGGGARAVLEAAGVRDVLTKSHGSNNPVNIVRATMKALESLESLDRVIGPSPARAPGPQADRATQVCRCQLRSKRRSRLRPRRGRGREAGAPDSHTED